MMTTDRIDTSTEMLRTIPDLTTVPRTKGTLYVMEKDTNILQYVRVRQFYSTLYNQTTAE